MKLLTVFGHPIEHSLSPVIHQAFAEQFDISLKYSKTDVAPGTFKQALETFHTNGGFAANVTVPYKGEAFEFCDSLSELAKRAQAVNTLLWQEGGLFGTNTDGQGFVNDLIKNHHQSLKGKRILILGAGGATRGILGPIIDEAPQTIVLANRTFEKAVDLSEAFERALLPMSYEDLGHVDGAFDYIINATSASLGQETLPISTTIVQNTFVYDLMYHQSRQTAFTQWASDNGAQQTTDGLGMLIEQAALGFELWFNMAPKTAPIFKLFENKS